MVGQVNVPEIMPFAACPLKVLHRSLLNAQWNPGDTRKSAKVYLFWPLAPPSPLFAAKDNPMNKLLQQPQWLLPMLLVVLAFVPVKHAAAQASQLAVPAADMVHLRLMGVEFFFTSVETACSGIVTGPFVRVSPNGNLANSEFEVPAGRELVMTDVVWAASRSWQGRAAKVRLRSLAASGSSAILFDTPYILEPDSGTRVITGSVNLTTGARLASRRKLCVEQISREAEVFARDNNALVQVEVYGYLIDK